MKELKTTKTICDQIAICEHKNIPIISDKILALDNIQNPYNLGALMRSALAFGFKQILLNVNNSSFYNEKAIRASQGAIFNIFI